MTAVVPAKQELLAALAHKERWACARACSQSYYFWLVYFIVCRALPRAAAARHALRARAGALYVVLIDDVFMRGGRAALRRTWKRLSDKSMISRYGACPTFNFVPSCCWCCGGGTRVRAVVCYCYLRGGMAGGIPRRNSCRGKRCDGVAQGAEVRPRVRRTRCERVCANRPCPQDTGCGGCRYHGS